MFLKKSQQQQKSINVLFLPVINILLYQVC